MGKHGVWSTPTACGNIGFTTHTLFKGEKTHTCIFTCCHARKTVVRMPLPCPWGFRAAWHGHGQSPDWPAACTEMGVPHLWRTL